MRAYLAASEDQQFDLVVAAETLQYLGPLEEIVANAFKVLKPGGYFSFTVDRRRTGEDEEGRDGVEEEEEEDEGGSKKAREEQVGVSHEGWPKALEGDDVMSLSTAASSHQ